MYHHRVSNSLGHLVKTIVGTSTIQDSHLEQAKENWIIDTSPIHLSQPFHPSDHVGPEPIIKKEVWVHIPPPMVVDDCFIVQLPSFSNTVKSVLGNLQFSISVSSIGNEEGNYLVSHRVVTKTRYRGMNPPIPSVDSAQEPPVVSWITGRQSLLLKTGGQMIGCWRIVAIGSVSIEERSK